MMMVVSDELTRSRAEQAALRLLREAAEEADGPMERHAIRVFLIAERIAKERDLAFDREVVLCASLLHDVGVLPKASRSLRYIDDGKELAREALGPELHGTRLAKCLETIGKHHHLRSQWDRGVEVELLRRADVIDGFPVLVRTTVERRWLRDLFLRVSRDGLYRQFLSPRRLVRVLPFVLQSLVNAVVFASAPRNRLVGGARGR